MKNTKILLAALLATIFSPAFATDAEAEPGPRQLFITHDVGELRALEGMRFTGPGLRMHGKPVKDAPYIAEVVSERQQNLTDGNQIVNRTTSASYRDSAGRTRQEVRDQKGDIVTVTIHDAVDGATYILNPRDKTATKIAVNKAAAEAARGRIEQMRKDGNLPGERKVERKEIIIRQFEGAEGGVRMQLPHDAPMRIEADQAEMKMGPNGREMAVRLGPIAGAFGDMKWAGKAVTKDLGTREIEGVKAEGKLRSYEIPAGEVGNRNPITVSDETWYSPALQVTVLSKHSDPRSGDNLYRLAGLKREEPAAALFAVPSDYTVKDVMANVTRLIEKKVQ